MPILMLTLAHLALLSQSLEPGQWQGTIEYQDEDVAFEFRVENQNDLMVIIIENGDENIRIDDVSIEGDSITIPLRPFDAFIKARIHQRKLEGYWKKGYRAKGIPFKARYGMPRFERSTKKGLKRLSGKWQIEFTPQSRQPYPSVALISSDNDFLTGTFLTEVGDLRFFKGVARNDSIIMSSFDGAHAFLFKAYVDQDRLSGVMVMDDEYSEEVSGMQSETASIPEPFKKIPSGHRLYYDILAAGDPSVKIDEDQYFNKVLVLQLFGTWCPNSMDQTQFLSNWHQNKPKNVEVLAVTYEPNFSTAYGNQRIRDYSQVMGLPYPINLGGELSKGQAALALPHLDKINAFPTLLLVDKEGFIRYEFSYFNGPATGEYHEEFVQKFETYVNELVVE